MRRILHAIPTLGRGGAERQLALLSGELSARGWDVHVAVRELGPNAAALGEGGATVHRVEATGNYHPALAVRYLSLVRRTRPAIVQTWLTQSDVLAGSAARATGTPWILSERSTAACYGRGMRDRLRRTLARGVTAVAANSPAGAEYWSGHVGPEVPCRVIPNGLSLAQLDAVRPGDRAALGVAEEQPLVLVVGRLYQPEKNVLGVVQAMKTVSERCGAVALFCGEGPDREALARAAAELGLDGRVRLVGDRQDVWSLMKSADLLVSASFFEGHPNAVLEAMGCGCPVVASDVPGHRGVLDEEMALFFDPADPGQIAARILATVQDRSAALARAQRARRRAERFSVAAMADAYERLYDDVLTGGH